MSQSRVSLLFLVVALAATAFWARRSPAPAMPTASSTATEPTASGTAVPAIKEPFMPRTVDADELHWVGFYEGFYGNGPGHSGGVHPVGSAKVNVNRPGKKIGLVLTAYEPILW